MNYPTFFVIAITITLVAAAAISGPLSILCLVGFWIANGFFITWQNTEKPLKDMSDSELQDVLNWWVKGKTNLPGGGTPEIVKLRRKGNTPKLQATISRVIAIYEEKLRRSKANNENDVKSYELRAELIQELTKLQEEAV